MANQQIALEVIAKDLATATLQRVNANVEAFTARTTTAATSSVKFGDGLSKAGNALNNLAGNMLGVNNQVANMAEGLLTFAGGGALVTGVALGITAIGGALFYLTKQARDAETAWRGWLKSMQQDSPLAQIGKELDALQEKLAAPEFGSYGRIARFLGFGESRTETIQKLAVVGRAYAEVFQSISASAVASGAKVAEDAAEAAAKALRDKIANDPTLRGLLPEKRIEAPAPDPLGLRGLDTGDLLDPAAVLNFSEQSVSALDQVRAVVLDLAAGFLELGASIGDAFAEALAGGEGFLGSIKAVQNALAKQARTHGAYDAVAALSALGRGLFGDPSQFAAAAKLAASSAAWFALSAALGGGGGGAIRGAAGGGAGSGRGFERDQRQIAEERGEVRVEVKRGVMRTDSPEFEDLLVDVLRRAGQRRVTVAYT